MPQAKTKVRRAKPARNTQTESTVWLVPAVKTRAATKDWPRFIARVIPPECCPDCGHVLKEPWAGSMIDHRAGEPFPILADPLFKQNAARAEAAAMTVWLTLPVGKAWLQHKATGSLRTYRALKGALTKQDKREKKARQAERDRTSRMLDREIPAPTGKSVAFFKLGRQNRGAK